MRIFRNVSDLYSSSAAQTRYLEEFQKTVDSYMREQGLTMQDASIHQSAIGNVVILTVVLP